MVCLENRGSPTHYWFMVKLRFMISVIVMARFQLGPGLELRLGYFLRFNINVIVAYARTIIHIQVHIWSSVKRKT